MSRPSAAALTPSVIEHCGERSTARDDSRLCEADREPAGAAPEVEDRARRPAMFQDEGLVKGEQRGIGKEGVIIPGGTGIVEIIPEGTRDAGGIARQSCIPIVYVLATWSRRLLPLLRDLLRLPQRPQHIAAENLVDLLPL